MTAPLPNFNRMLALIDDVFSTRNDPGQLQVDEQVIKKLTAIHPSTLSEFADENGPLIWVLVIPTTKNVMDDFLAGKISEREILERANPADSFHCIYLCSATTLPEYRGKGATKKLCIEAIRSICKEHPVKTLFVWPFTSEGKQLAESVSKECNLELLFAQAKSIK